MTKQNSKQTLEEFRNLYPTTWSKMDTNMKMDFEFFIKKVYEAGGEAEREKRGDFKPITNHSCTNPVSCPWCNSESIKVTIETK